MRPKPRFFISGKAARTSMSGARTKIAMKPSQISGVSSPIPGARASASGRTLLMPTPALLMTASIAPKRARAAATAAAQPFASARSARMGWRRVERFGVAIDGRDAMARGQQRLRHRNTDAARCSGEKNDAATRRCHDCLRPEGAEHIGRIRRLSSMVGWAEGGPMSGLKIYGVARTRAFRALWVAEELGLAYEHVPIEIGEAGARKPEFLALNPNGRLPLIVDGDFVLTESLAITLYLAKKYAHGTLYPVRPLDEARAWQWSFWAIAEVDRGVNIWSLHAVRLPPGERDAALRAEALGVLAAPFKVLDAALSENPYLLGPDFTIADLNVAAVISRGIDMDLSTWPNLENWLLRCLERPAARRALALKTRSDAETPVETTRRIARINRLRV